MKLRVLAIVAFVLMVGAIGAWIWSGSSKYGPSEEEMPERLGGPIASQSSDASSIPTPSGPSSDLTPSRPAGEQPATRVPITSSVVAGMPLVRSGPAPVAPPAPEGSRGPVGEPVTEPEGRAQVEAVTYMLRDFRTRIGENPVGTNAEIMKTVMGGNSARARLGPPEGQSLNENGELVDRWETPYFFHQMSKDRMEIRSAGPDRKMWTKDDLVAQ